MSECVKNTYFKLRVTVENQNKRNTGYLPSILKDETQLKTINNNFVICGFRNDGQSSFSLITEDNDILCNRYNSSANSILLTNPYKDVYSGELVYLSEDKQILQINVIDVPNFILFDFENTVIFKNNKLDNDGVKITYSDNIFYITITNIYFVEETIIDFIIPVAIYIEGTNSLTANEIKVAGYDAYEDSDNILYESFHKITTNDRLLGYLKATSYSLDDPDRYIIDIYHTSNTTKTFELHLPDDIYVDLIRNNLELSEFKICYYENVASGTIFNYTFDLTSKTNITISHNTILFTITNFYSDLPDNIFNSLNFKDSIPYVTIDFTLLYNGDINESSYDEKPYDIDIEERFHITNIEYDNSKEIQFIKNFHFNQWDWGQYLVFTNLKEDENIVEAHFFIDNKYGDAIKVVSVIYNNSLAFLVPDTILQEAGMLNIYLYMKSEYTGRTLHILKIPIVGRPKPGDYSNSNTEDSIGLLYDQLSSLLKNIRKETDASSKYAEEAKNAAGTAAAAAAELASTEAADLASKKTASELSDYIIPTAKSMKLETSKWVSATSTDKAFYSFESEYPKSKYDLELYLDGDNATTSEHTAYVNIKPESSINENKIYAAADGAVPNIDIPVILSIRKKAE